MRCRGRARDEGPGGESAEGGGEAMVVEVVCADARWCRLYGLLGLHQCVLAIGCDVRNMRGWRLS